ncbi:MAG TPA: PepSY domain-containing protein [Bryobacteraceae bacterium]|nr:PepSY domain-containing protein [Bryobacteraceae bacterium]
MTALRKFAILCHRWMGVAFCLLFTWWFVSGIFMMYWDFPAVRDADRLAHAQPLDASRIRVSPEQAYIAVGIDIPPDQVRLARFDGRPAYWFGAIPDQVIVYADDGKVQESYPPELNLRTAAAWAGLPSSDAKVEEIREPDQWTVAGALRDALPLIKYSWPDGQHVYVGPTSGQVMQYTTHASRLGAWLGPIPHWLYFTPLRVKDSLWSRIVIWLSGVGTLMAISGLVVGVLVYSPSKRYRYEGQPVGIPYSGTKRLHMIFGLFFGIVACTWAFSGMLSMEPFPALAAGRPATELEDRISHALRAESVELAAFSERLPAAALASVPPNLKVKELELVSFAGAAAYIVRGSVDPGETESSWVVPVRGAPGAMFERERMIDAIGRAVVPPQLAEVRIASQYEAYYVDRKGERPLPVLFVRVGGERKGEEGAGFYVDPRTAKIVGRRNPGGWFNRWLYHGLHSLDFPWLYNHRPAWDIVVLLLLAGGTTLSVTSAIIAWKLLQRKIAG